MDQMTQVYIMIFSCTLLFLLTMAILTYFTMKPSSGEEVSD